MDLTHLIKNPKDMDRETLYELRSLLALYPYFQTARLLMLHNLFLLHDPTFDEELRSAAIYVTDRKVLFDLVEAAHYKIKTTKKETAKEKDSDRTMALIDDFLNIMPPEQEKTTERQKRRPTPADATIDYIAYLMENDKGKDDGQATPQLKGQELIDSFLENGEGRIELSTEQQEGKNVDKLTDSATTTKEPDESYFTETLAQIYIKQGRYGKALEIIRRLSLNIPKKNAYFADQIRFLEKLIDNENNKK